ncbi:unnamed protein product [Calicophoron daubneyi]|uniref:G-protein coupled receptors family 1 profile domain-containing protein n=1 Tax=Calicophoron daubneyi TaxID=300641 RepID=A0AAV2TUJ8_CALDB
MDLPPGVEIYGGFTRVANLSELVTSENFSVQKFVWYDLTEFGRSDRFRITYHLWSWNILVVGLPFVTIAFMNSFLIREVRRSSLRGLKQGQQRETRRHETDVMLIGVIVIFFVCQLPAAISHISWGVIPPKDTQKMFWFLLNEIGNLLIVVNSAINLVPYYMFSRRFRRHFIQIFCSYRLVRDDGWHCVHVPRWVAENMAKDASDNYASGGNAVYQRRYSIRLTNCHRNAGSNPNIRRSLADNLTVRSNSRNSAIRLERGRRRSQRLSSGLSRLPQNFSQSEKESLPNLRESETINNHACDLEAEKEIARRSTTVHVNFHMQPTPNIMTTNTVL